MKNLNVYGVQELDRNEMVMVEGGAAANNFFGSLANFWAGIGSAIIQILVPAVSTTIEAVGGYVNNLIADFTASIGKK